MNAVRGEEFGVGRWEMRGFLHPVRVYGGLYVGCQYADATGKGHTAVSLAKFNEIEPRMTNDQISLNGTADMM